MAQPTLDLCFLAVVLLVPRRDPTVTRDGRFLFLCHLAYTPSSRLCPIKNPYDSRARHRVSLEDPICHGGAPSIGVASKEGGQMQGYFLTENERERQRRFPEAIPPRDVSDYFTLSETDRCRVNQQRGAHNRLGFALQLCA